MRQHDDIGVEAASVDRIRRLMSELDESDLERVDPPEGIWERIEASIASIEARRPPSRTEPSPMVVEYRIDADDVLIDVGNGWATFARENGAAELAAPGPDRTLWSFIDRAEITELWQLLVQRVRASQRPAQVPFRCDAPDARRWFDMTVAPEPGGSVHFRSVLVFEERRPPVALLDPHTERDAAVAPLLICSWCGRGHHGAGWLEVEELIRAGRLLEQASMPAVSYGLCAACREAMAADLFVSDLAGDAPA
jgi:hypothetical protein